MAGQLDRMVGGLLETHTHALRDAGEREAIVESRAFDASRIAITATTRGVTRYLATGGSTDPIQQDRRHARAHIAGILSLIGRGDMNVGDFAAPEIVIARDVNHFGVLYDKINASLGNVAVKDYDGGPVNPDLLARRVSPENITGARIHLTAQQKGTTVPKYVRGGNMAAWIADHEMPSRLRGREHYTSPAKIGHMAELALKAMADPELNPQFYGLNFVSDISAHLTLAVKDLSISGPHLYEAFDVPEWVPSSATASS
jgi:hypothetical protein